MRKPSDRWTVYGWAIDPARTASRRVHMDFEHEESGWQAIMQEKLRATDCALMLIHITHRPHKLLAGHWRAVHNVLLRTGDIKGWWE